MLDFRVQNVVPPGGRYFYEVPETRYYVEDFTLDAALERVRRHYLENGLAVPDGLRARMKDFMCRRLPEGFCFGTDGQASGIRIYTTAEIRNNTRQLVVSGGPATPGEAKSRADVCGRCPLNDRSACPTCTGMVSWATRMVGGRTTGYEQVLGICGVDGVLVAAKVFVANVPGNSGYPEACWRYS